MRSTWRKNLVLGLVILGCLVVGLGLAGCDFLSSDSSGAVQQVEDWAAHNKQLAEEAKQDGDLASGFHPKPPPTSSSVLKELRERVPAAVESGDEARDAITKFGEENELVEKEAESFGCVLYGEVASGELSSDLASLED